MCKGLKNLLSNCGGPNPHMKRMQELWRERRMERRREKKKNKKRDERTCY